jgi:hypothetical protein
MPHFVILLAVHSVESNEEVKRYTTAVCPGTELLTAHFINFPGLYILPKYDSVSLCILL